MKKNLRQTILESAFELFFEKGYEETTIQDIIDRANVARGSFYYHFRGKDELLKSAVEKFPDLRILRQDPWIALISFILSQNNNIKRIKGLYDTIARNYGHEVEPGYWSFPTPEEFSRATQSELRDLRVGFRDKYLIDAISKAELLEGINDLPYEEAEKRLMSIKGVGTKVASCILLFGCHRMEAFPVDVWIRKVLDTYYPGKDLSYFEPYPALCQQYLFSMARYIKL